MKYNNFIDDMKESSMNINSVQIKQSIDLIELHIQQIRKCVQTDFVVCIIEKINTTLKNLQNKIELIDNLIILGLLLKELFPRVGMSYLRDILALVNMHYWYISKFTLDQRLVNISKEIDSSLNTILKELKEKV